MKKSILIFMQILLVTTLVIPLTSAIKVNAVDEGEMKYSGEYNIEEMISKYNIVALGQKTPTDTAWYNDGLGNGTVTNFIHIVGPMLVEGNLGTSSNQQTAHSQNVYGASTYIKGKIIARGNAVQSSDDTSSANLYLGIDNVVEQYCKINNWGCNDDNKNNYRINSFDYYTKYPTYVDTEDSTYLDFKKLYNELVKDQNSLEEGKVLSNDNYGTTSDDIYRVGDDIYIASSGTYTIESVKDIKKIHFLNYNKDELTVITIKDEGNLTKFPATLMGEDELPTNDYIYKNGDNEKYYGNIVFSLPNAQHIMMTQAPFFGHMIAPNADVEIPEMHFAGAMIVNSISGSGNTEAHMYPYTVDTLGKLPRKSTTNPPSDDNTSNSNSNGNSNNNSNSNSNSNSNNNDNDNSNNNDNDDKGDDPAEESNSNSNNHGVNGATEENPSTFDNITTLTSIIVFSVITTVLLSGFLYKINYQKNN